MDFDIRFRLTRLLCAADSHLEAPAPCRAAAPLRCCLCAGPLLWEPVMVKRGRHTPAPAEVPPQSPQQLAGSSGRGAHPGPLLRHSTRPCHLMPHCHLGAGQSMVRAVGSRSDRLLCQRESAISCYLAGSFDCFINTLFCRTDLGR